MNLLSNASIDALGNSIIKKYLSYSNDMAVSVDIQGFAEKYLKLPVIYRSFAESDASKLGFISDGKTPLNVLHCNKAVATIFPKGTIVIEKYLQRKSELGRCRFTIAHEAAHYILDRSLVTAGFHREFDREALYTPNELREIFNISETNVDRLASALLMPEFMMKDYLMRNGRENGIFLYDDNFIRPEDNFILQRMASDMKVSNSALLIRISQLQLYERRPIDEYISELGLESGVPC